MVNACPPQSDPRPNVADFISNKDNKALAGLTVEGLETLVKVVEDELRTQEPDSNIFVVDREFLGDENITFAKDLTSFIDRKLSEGKKLNMIICGNMQAYYATLACRQVPLCTKIGL